MTVSVFMDTTVMVSNATMSMNATQLQVQGSMYPFFRRGIHLVDPFGPFIHDKVLQPVVMVVSASTLKALSHVNVLLAMLFKESSAMISMNAVCSLTIVTLTPIAPIQMAVIHVFVISAILPLVMARMKMVVWTLMNAQPLTTHVTRTQNALTQRAAMTAIVKMDLLVMVCIALISTNAK